MTIRTNSTIKSEAQAIFAELGLDMSTAVNAFFRQTIREKGLPFALTTKEDFGSTPNRVTRKVLRDSAKGKNLVGPFKTVEETMKYLNA